MHFDFWIMVKNPVIVSGFIAAFLAQFIKIFTCYKDEGKFKISRFFNSSGMPSSHSSGVTAATTALGMLYGFDSAFFAIAFVFSVVVMYDAAGVRYESGKQATIINFIVEEIRDYKPGQEFHAEKLKELIGHRPIEVLVGAILGISVAVTYCVLFLK